MSEEIDIGELLKLGDEITFVYKVHKKCHGTVVRITKNVILLTLLADYIGKNEEWYSGESKPFNKSEMKQVVIKKRLSSNP
jgi:hypothetical protein